MKKFKPRGLVLFFLLGLTAIVAIYGKVPFTFNHGNSLFGMPLEILKISPSRKAVLTVLIPLFTWGVIHVFTLGLIMKHTESKLFKRISFFGNHLFLMTFSSLIDVAFTRTHCYKENMLWIRKSNLNLRA